MAMRNSIRRISLTTPDLTDVIVTTLNDLDNVISLDLDPSRNKLYFTDVHHDVIRSRDVLRLPFLFVLLAFTIFFRCWVLNNNNNNNEYIYIAHNKQSSDTYASCLVLADLVHYMLFLLVAKNCSAGPL